MNGTRIAFDTNVAIKLMDLLHSLLPKRSIWR